MNRPSHSALLILFILALAASAAAQCVGPEQPEKEKPSLLASPARHTDAEPYVPITGRERVQWFLSSTVGPSHLLGGGIFSAAIGTAMDRPREYGPGWGGFADRFGMRLTGISTGNALEAGLGVLWGEDPRYFSAENQSVRNRVLNVIKHSFEARRHNGQYAPAYARFIAVSGNNFLSNSWRVHSEANSKDALIRISEGFAGRVAANAFEEFWPDVKKKILRRDR